MEYLFKFKHIDMFSYCSDVYNIMLNWSVYKRHLTVYWTHVSLFITKLHALYSQRPCRMRRVMREERDQCHKMLSNALSSFIIWTEYVFIKHRKCILVVKSGLKYTEECTLEQYAVRDESLWPAVVGDREQCVKKIHLLVNLTCYWFRKIG